MPNWTQEQQKVIDLRDRNILVSAAAGSGKTAVLVERIIKKITDEKKPVDIDRLLVVTFTKAAAAEMRARIGAALEMRLQEEPDNENLQHQLSLLHNAQITTIDSFCQYIIRNYFHVIDLEPGFKVADETDLQLIQENVLSELLEEKYRIAREENDRGFLNTMQIFSTGRTDKDVEDLVLKLYRLAQSYPFPEKQLEQWAEGYAVNSVQELEQSKWMQQYFADIKCSIADYAAMAKKAVNLCLEQGGPQGYLPTIQAEAAQIENLLTAESMVELYEGLTKLSFDKLKAARGKDIDVDLRDQVKALRTAYKDKGVQRLQEEIFYQSPEEMLKDIKGMEDPVRELVQLALDFGEHFAARKIEEGVIDFNDMEHFALKTLVEEDEEGNIVPGTIAKELQEHYEEVLTDEYQDSNFVQEMILTSLCQGAESGPYLFMVGDVKQSIYQFRLARPDLFMEKYHTFSTGDSKNQRIDLRKNFRSRASVLESANYIFEKIMRTEFGGIAYDDAARLVPGAEFGEWEKRTADQTEVILVEQNAEGAAGTGKRSLEAVAIGEKIREMVQGDTPLYIQDKTSYRPVQYRDIVILLRSLQGWSEEFQETLAEMGIPVYAPKKTGYFATLEVETILNFLRIIDNPRQDIPLAAVLRSGLFGLEDEELAYIGAMPGRINFWDSVCAWAEGEALSETMQNTQEKLSRFLDTLKYYQAKAEYVSVYELLREIYDSTGYYSIISAMPGGEQRSANLDILLQQAIEFAENGHRGIFAFCRYIEKLRKSDIDFGEASLNGEGANAVQLVSIHKSKGLEFPVVFVAGMGKQFNLQDSRRRVLLDMDYGVGANYVDLEQRYTQPTLLKRFIASHMIENTLTEEVRILYVALTRAKEKLIITGVVKDSAKKFPLWQQKGMVFGRQELLNAVTYLDWIMPAISGRMSFKRCAGKLCDSEESLPSEEVMREGIDSGDADSLFRLKIVFPETETTQEKEELERILWRREELKNWDIDITYDEEVAAAMERQRSYRYPFAGESKMPVKVSVSELKRRMLEQQDILLRDEDSDIEEAAAYETDISEMPQPSFRRGEEKISGAARGTLYHLVMEHIPYEELDDQYDFSNLLVQLERDGYITADERAEIYTGSLAKFAKSSLGKRMKKAALAETLHREKQFMVGIPATEVFPDLDSEETILVQGIIDACFEEEGEWILVDYKTDWVKSGQERELVEKYREQLARYAGALEQLTGKRVREKWIYSFSLGKAIKG
ncbi:MAG: helicase-exonuclease AddAB subunit AddA [Lachnospiraceae bacterium]|nr:helicase-exonuclease AddAB subunit AddA [Lachnospiraceae bacterium]